MSTKVKKIILILIILAILIGGYFLYKFISTKNPDKKANQTSNQIDNWKTYNNDKHNFFIKYPNDWTAEEIPNTNQSSVDENFYVNFLSPETIQSRKDNGITEIANGFQIYISSKTTNQQNYYTEQFNGATDKKSITVDNKTATAWNVIYAMGNPYTTLIDYNNLYFEITDLNSNHQSDGIYNKFLMSFHIE